MNQEAHDPVIEGRLIICIASSWDYDPTGKHHIMKRLARRNAVVWVNHHGLRRPRPNRSDARGCIQTLRRVAGGARSIGPSMIQVTPMLLPGAASRVSRAINQFLVTRQIHKAVRSMKNVAARPVQVWSFAPDVPYLCGAFGEECFIYYCVDEHSEFEGVDRDRVSALERETMLGADLVLTTSESLQSAKRGVRPDAVLVRHGVDFDHFSSAWRQRLESPPDVSSIPKPIFGFFGLIQHWVDIQLLARVARLRPDYSFVLIGECRTGIDALRSLPNVHVLGRRHYSSLPAYCAAFDAGLLPFKADALTRHVNPIKMYEYLAAGLPIVSTSLPEARRFVGPIVIADGAEPFAHACDRVIRNQDPEKRMRISGWVENETWDARVEELSELVMRRIEGQHETVSRRKAEVLPWPLPNRNPALAGR